jgi:alpha-D-ribose 1-methylphosphonate 5-triphosphate synthase subunit PhnL
MLLDEPTASLDFDNKETVLELILEAKAHGTAFIGTFHDKGERGAVASRTIQIQPTAKQ